MHDTTNSTSVPTKREKFFDPKKHIMLIALVGLIVAFELLTLGLDKGNFLNPRNITNLFNQNSYVVILAVGMLICILTGGNIDLSVGSGVCMISAIAGVLMVNLGVNIYLSIVLCLLTGIAMGALQGYFIAYVRIPAFIVTLAGMLTFRGIGYVILNGYTISPFPEEYTRIFNGFLPPIGTDDVIRVAVSMGIAVVACMVIIVLQGLSRTRRRRNGYPVEPFAAMAGKLAIVLAILLALFYLFSMSKGIPVILITLVTIVLVYHWYLSRTVAGRHLYAMGGNEKAAIFSGVNTNRVMFLAYTNMGFLVAVASLVCIARFNSASPAAGTMYELDAIGACFLGGASAYGGVGTVGGSVIGAAFMGVLNNGMSILGIDTNWQRAVKGVVLLLAVLVDVSAQKKHGNARGVFLGGLFKPRKAVEAKIRE